MTSPDELRRIIESGAGAPIDMAMLRPPGGRPDLPPALRMRFYPNAGFGGGGPELLPPGVAIQGVDADEVSVLFFDTTDHEGLPEKHIFWLDKRMRQLVAEKCIDRMPDEDLETLIEGLRALLAERAAERDGAESGQGERKVALPGD